MTVLLSCETHACTSEAAFVVYWPGQSKRFCEPCTARAKNIARAMGFTVEAQPIALVSPAPFSHRGGWVHSMCQGCWDARNPARQAFGVDAGPEECCCFCGSATKAGIYYRHAPDEGVLCVSCEPEPR